MHKICYFDITAENVGKMKDFYGQLFGWTFKRFEESQQEYWFIHPDGKGTQNQDNMRPSSIAEKEVGAAVAKKTGHHKGFLNYFSVANIDAHLQKVQALGGSVIAPKSAVTGFGYMAVCADPEGNHFAFWEDNNDAK